MYSLGCPDSSEHEGLNVGVHRHHHHHHHRRHRHHHHSQQQQQSHLQPRLYSYASVPSALSLSDRRVKVAANAVEQRDDSDPDAELPGPSRQVYSMGLTTAEHQERHDEQHLRQSQRSVTRSAATEERFRRLHQYVSEQNRQNREHSEMMAARFPEDECLRRLEEDRDQFPKVIRIPADMETSIEVVPLPPLAESGDTSDDSLDPMQMDSPQPHDRHHPQQQRQQQPPSGVTTRRRAGSLLKRKSPQGSSGLLSVGDLALVSPILPSRRQRQQQQHHRHRLEDSPFTPEHSSSDVDIVMSADHSAEENLSQPSGRETPLKMSSGGNSLEQQRKRKSEKEKERRNLINQKFQLLSELLHKSRRHILSDISPQGTPRASGRPSRGNEYSEDRSAAKVEKNEILSDAIAMIQKLQESNEQLRSDNLDLSGRLRMLHTQEGSSGILEPLPLIEASPRKAARTRSHSTAAAAAATHRQTMAATTCSHTQPQNSPTSCSSRSSGTAAESPAEIVTLESGAALVMLRATPRSRRSPRRRHSRSLQLSAVSTPSVGALAAAPYSHQQSLPQPTGHTIEDHLDQHWHQSPRLLPSEEAKESAAVRRVLVGLTSQGPPLQFASRSEQSPAILPLPINNTPRLQHEHHSRPPHPQRGPSLPQHLLAQPQTFTFSDPPQHVADENSFFVPLANQALSRDRYLGNEIRSSRESHAVLGVMDGESFGEVSGGSVLGEDDFAPDLHDAPRPLGLAVANSTSNDSLGVYLNAPSLDQSSWQDMLPPVVEPIIMPMAGSQFY